MHPGGWYLTQWQECNPDEEGCGAFQPHASEGGEGGARSAPLRLRADGISDFGLSRVREDPRMYLAGERGPEDV